MDRRVDIYKDRQINIRVLKKIRRIAKERCTEKIYIEYFKCIVSELECYKYSKDTSTIIVLGEDWFLVYEVTESSIAIHNWVALDTSKNKFAQTIEMISALKKILLDNQDKSFHACMRHDTSYQFYLCMLANGLLEEVSDTIAFDEPGVLPPALDSLRIEKGNMLPEELLNSDYAKKYQECLHYILHDIEFQVSDKFVNRYRHKRTKKKENI